MLTAAAASRLCGCRLWAHQLDSSTSDMAGMKQFMAESADGEARAQKQKRNRARAAWSETRRGQHRPTEDEGARAKQRAQAAPAGRAAGVRLTGRGAGGHRALSGSKFELDCDRSGGRAAQREAHRAERSAQQQSGEREGHGDAVSSPVPQRPRQSAATSVQCCRLEGSQSATFPVLHTAKAGSMPVPQVTEQGP